MRQNLHVHAEHHGGVEDFEEAQGECAPDDHRRTCSAEGEQLLSRAGSFSCMSCACFTHTCMRISVHASLRAALLAHRKCLAESSVPRGRALCRWFASCWHQGEPSVFAREAKRTAAPATDGRRKRQVPGVDYHHSEFCQVRTSG